ncbi:tyrosine-type recombinase/integrase [Sneathiella glossodoripedis]|uniref:tyrosine-type recombinase/integrase n=1 Tax=Sneathiella glossodoripedis TaxID=418853 RepID=UPI00046FEF65|nr:tyrosine-type recombinase/integrase [Sneathiella glossodoripedis]
MDVKTPGVKAYWSNGKKYYYHRKSGVRIKEKYGTLRFALKVEELNQIHEPEKFHSIPGTWGELVERYRGSEEFRRLAPRTKSDYQKIFSYLSGTRMAPLERITPVSLEKLKNHALKERKRDFANKLRSVMSLTFNFGVRNDICKKNPAEKLRKIPRDKHKPPANRPWTNEEITTVLENAQTAEIAAGIGLSAYTALRSGDMLSLKWSDYQNGFIQCQQSKTGDFVWVPVIAELKAILDKMDRKSPWIVLNTRGKPYTSSGFQTQFQKLKRSLIEQGKIGEGLTFHGLRVTVATRLAEAGCTINEIRAVTGHTTNDSVERYVRTVDQKGQAQKAMQKLEQSKYKSV